DKHGRGRGFRANGKPRNHKRYVRCRGDRFAGISHPGCPDWALGAVRTTRSTPRGPWWREGECSAPARRSFPGGRSGAGPALVGRRCQPARAGLLWEAMVHLTADVLGLAGPLGERATLLQISSGFCAPCRAARGVLTRVAE